MVRGTLIALLWASALLPVPVLAFSSGPPIPSTGVPVDGGQTCQRCHSTFALNPPGGFVRVDAVNYKPGQVQTVRVTVSHPEALRWGFQLTARRASDQRLGAGSFVVAEGFRVRCTGRDTDATEADPCSSEQQQFIEHTASVTRGGVNGSNTFEIQWRAPDTDIGEVLFYASGNASNNDGTNRGDRIYNNADAPTRISAEAVCPTGLRPTVRDIRNAASGGREVAMNTLISIFGSGFAAPTSRISARPDLRAGFPRDLACVSVEINGAQVPLTYVQENQINAQMPTLSATGNVSYRVLVNGVASDQGTLNVVNYAPALFTFDGKAVAAVAPDGTYIGGSSVAPGARPARPGEVIQLFATGLGATEPVWQAGEIPGGTARVRDAFAVTIGGTTVPAGDITYAGLAPGQISGLYQINVRVPASLADGDAPVTISVGGISSPAGTVLPVKR